VAFLASGPKSSGKEVDSMGCPSLDLVYYHHVKECWEISENPEILKDL
jgi:hypothetical protein